VQAANVRKITDPFFSINSGAAVARLSADLVQQYVRGPQLRKIEAQGLRVGVGFWG